MTHNSYHIFSPFVSNQNLVIIVLHPAHSHKNIWKQASKTNKTKTQQQLPQTNFRIIVCFPLLRSEPQTSINKQNVVHSNIMEQFDFL